MKRLIFPFLSILIFFSGCKKQSVEEFDFFGNIEVNKQRISQKEVYDLEVFRKDIKNGRYTLIVKGKSEGLTIKDITIEFQGQVFELRYLSASTYESSSNNNYYTKASLYFDK